jgi:hypothetical protein
MAHAAATSAQFGTPAIISLVNQLAVVAVVVAGVVVEPVVVEMGVVETGVVETGVVTEVAGAA